MRYKLLFTDVSSIIPADSHDVELPDNIVFAEGGTRLDRYNEASSVLRNQPNVNAVIMLEPKTGDLSKAINELDTLAEGRRFRSTHNVDATPSSSDPYASLCRYIKQRRISFGNPLIGGVPHDLISNASDIWAKACAEIAQIDNMLMKQSITTYVPNYNGRRTQEGSHINTHIDAQTTPSDMRIIECLAGSGTLVFDDNDFTVTDKDTISLIKRGIKCWELPEGSSLAIRIPSETTANMGARGTVHAHGIGQPDDTPEQRWTIRHDLTFD